MTNPQRTGISPVRAALSQADRFKTERSLLTPEQVPGHAIFWRIVLAPYVAKHEGLIQMPEIIEQAEQVACSLGRIIQLGFFAFKSKTAAGLDLALEPHIPTVGKYVLHEPYAGIRVRLRGKNRTLRIINETDILMVVDDPEEIRGYL